MTHASSSPGAWANVTPETITPGLNAAAAATPGGIEAADVVSVPAIMDTAHHHGSNRLGLRTMEYIVSASIARVPGTAKVSGTWKKIGGQNFPRMAIQMDPDTWTVAIDVAIATVWPSPVTDIAARVRSAIAEEVIAMSGFQPTRVNVIVGHTIPGERVTAENVAAHVTRKPWHPETAPSRIVSPAIPEPRPLRPTTTTNTVRIVSPDTPAAPAVRSPESTPDFVPLPVEVAAHSAASAPLRTVSAPAPLPLRSPELPPEQPLVRVAAPAPVTPWSPSAPTPQPLRPLKIESFARHRHVEAPDPEPLRAIEIIPLFGKEQP